MKTATGNSCSLFLVRLGLGIVFALFGYDKLPHPESWIVYYPPLLHRWSPLPPLEWLRFQGVAETLLGIALVLGFMTRLSAVTAAGVLALIVVFLGFDPVAIRDAGLFFAAFSLAISGPGEWSLDAWLTRGGGL